MYDRPIKVSDRVWQATQYEALDDDFKPMDLLFENGLPKVNQSSFKKSPKVRQKRYDDGHRSYQRV